MYSISDISDQKNLRARNIMNRIEDWTTRAPHVGEIHAFHSLFMSFQPDFGLSLNFELTSDLHFNSNISLNKTTMIKLKEEIDLRGYTLILPSVAVGNVGQLAVDLFISSLSAKRIGYIWDTAFIPIIGPDPYDENSSDLCTAVDFFSNVDKKILLLQIRSPLSKKPLLFFDELQNFITEKKLAKVVILTSSYSHEKRDQQIRTVPLRYVASSNVRSEHGTKFDELNWMHLENKVVENRSQEILEIPGGGFAKNLYDALVKINIPCAILLRFCSEGDNIPDALELANYSNQWLEILPKDDSGNLVIKKPPSWKFLFGNNPPAELF